MDNKSLTYLTLCFVFGLLALVAFGAGWIYWCVEATLLGVVFIFTSGLCMYKMLD